MRPLRKIKVKNFLSLRDVDVELGDLTVLVGPNGAGKSNLLKAIQFLGDTARDDLGPALATQGGLKELFFRGPAWSSKSVQLGIVARITRYSSETALDEYDLQFWQQGRTLRRREEFKFKRTSRQGRRITVDGAKVEIVDETMEARQRTLQASSAALSTLQRLGEDEGAQQVGELAQLFESFRVFDVDVARARLPSPVRFSETLSPDASNLAAYLAWLRDEHEDVFDLLRQDLSFIVPTVRELRFEPIGGATEAVKVVLVERSLSGVTELAHASYGTVRALALLAMLHEPNPPPLTCVEEIDHGLHPHALDRIVERLRSATRRTQLLLATHSPALVNRLKPEELVICERDPTTGASLIPAIDTEQIRAIADEDELGLGELWFSGTLGGAL